MAEPVGPLRLPSPTPQALEGSASQDGQEMAHDSQRVEAETAWNFTDLKHTPEAPSLESLQALPDV